MDGGVDRMRCFFRVDQTAHSTACQHDYTSEFSFQNIRLPTKAALEVHVLWDESMILWPLQKNVIVTSKKYNDVGS